MLDMYEDHIRRKKTASLSEFTTEYQDFRYHASSVTPDIKLAINVIKPLGPAPMLVKLHGWHMSMPEPQKRVTPADNMDHYLVVQVDMRGRAFSEGEADCNGYELMDIYDAIQFVRKEYAHYLSDPELIYLEGGSGGGGNVLAMLGKFPDTFAAASSFYPMSDYAKWYVQDEVGEFRDEMDVWIGCPPEVDSERYEARSGIHLVNNLHTPLYLAHGDGDIRVPVDHARAYVRQAQAYGKSQLIQYEELPGVGGRGHQDGITAEQLAGIQEASDANRRNHAVPVTIPQQGTLQIGGYLYTKPFQIVLDSMDHVAQVEYSLPNNTYQLRARNPYPYTLSTFDGRVITGICSVITNSQ
ncbi:alpha/beta fold hydrolase [Paenibacillus qinlingensis]|uniref:Pimeloyl-ACP methyl ester carboxylesterase n=1 Tax=Paenibacillus qinlingensis TaxID=1837343 RepID=A0ABU1P6H2_9BACL|nr:alpha/beta fold hydrolase [Paenibacillus qinlingensis]MDR6555354.1 pimeloyl-ACP methyl ester carboxylesterase [Paenibacillus qinlingensis]